MPIERHVAEQITKLVEQSTALCNASLNTVKVNESLGHVQVYGRLAAFFLGHSYTNLLAPVWKAFPDLEPPQMKEPYSEPAPSFTAESVAAISAFVTQASEAAERVKVLLGTENLNSLPYGGLPEVEKSVAHIYVAVPNKHDLNLGKYLALTFAEERLADSHQAVANIFHQRGAYGRFKDLLERKGLLQTWYDFEAKATEVALREWAAGEGFSIMAGAGKNEG